jgi:hypothetical protein
MGPYAGDAVVPSSAHRQGADGPSSFPRPTQTCTHGPQRLSCTHHHNMSCLPCSLLQSTAATGKVERTTPSPAGHQGPPSPSPPPTSTTPDSQRTHTHAQRRHWNTNLRAARSSAHGFRYTANTTTHPSTEKSQTLRPKPHLVLVCGSQGIQEAHPTLQDRQLAPISVQDRHHIVHHSHQWALMTNVCGHAITTRELGAW